MAERITSKFLLRSDWTLAVRGAARVKLHLIQCPLSCDLWLVGAAFACTPLFFKRGSRALPGQSRLNHRQAQMRQTAPTIKNNRFKTTKFLFRSDWPFFWPAAPLVLNYIQNYRLATKALRHEGMICILILVP